jgi:hypothetical protein
LMVLCDRLQAQQQERETRHAALTRASLARFADAPTPANLSFIFHQSYDIPAADLRKSILTLAVQGKLVPQHPNDEPASELFKRIESEQAQQHAEGLYRSSMPLPPIRDDEKPFPLPPGGGGFGCGPWFPRSETVYMALPNIRNVQISISLTEIIWSMDGLSSNQIRRLFHSMKCKSTGS